MGESRYAKDPLMYIHQPKREIPKAQMQSNYYSTRKKAEQPKEQKKSPKPMRSIKRNFYYDDEKVADLEENMVDQDESELEKAENIANEKQQENKTTKFIDLTLEQKIQYFVDRRSDIVQIRCEVLTENQSYKGIIYDYKDDKIYMRSGRRNYEVHFNEVLDIKLLGF